MCTGSAPESFASFVDKQGGAGSLIDTGPPLFTSVGPRPGRSNASCVLWLAGGISQTLASYLSTQTWPARTEAGQRVRPLFTAVRISASPWFPQSPACLGRYVAQESSSLEPPGPQDCRYRQSPKAPLEQISCYQQT